MAVRALFLSCMFLTACGDAPGDQSRTNGDGVDRDDELGFTLQVAPSHLTLSARSSADASKFVVTASKLIDDVTASPIPEGVQVVMNNGSGHSMTWSSSTGFILLMVSPTAQPGDYPLTVRATEMRGAGETSVNVLLTIEP